MALERNKRLHSAVGAAFSAALAITVPYTSAQAKPEQFTVFTGPVNTGFWLVGGWIAGKMTEDGVRANSEVGAALTNIMRVSTGEGELGLTFSASAGMAKEGTPPFPSVMDNFQSIALFQQSATHVLVREDSGVESCSDLESVTYSAQAVGNLSQLAFRDFLAGCGLKEEDLSLAIGGQQFGCDGTKDERYVGFAAMSAYPGPVFMDCATSFDATFLPVTDEMWDVISPINTGYVRAEIPADTYPGQEEAVPTFGTSALFVVHEDMSEEDAYYLTKLVGDNFDEFTSIIAAMNELTMEDVANVQSVEMHPGAKRYWQEVGVLQ